MRVAPEYQRDASALSLLYTRTAEGKQVPLSSVTRVDTGVYSKIRVRVQTLEGDVLAWLYVLDAWEGGLPSARYLGIMADAAEAAGAPDDYVAELRARPCRSVGP